MKGEYTAPSTNWNLWLKEEKPRQKNPGPPGWVVSKVFVVEFFLAMVSVVFKQAKTNKLLF